MYQRLESIGAYVCRWAEQTPMALAVKEEEKSLTYAQLEEKSTQLAVYLKSLGVGAGMVVGVSLKKGCDLLISMLGIWKVGGVYFPIDWLYQKERIDLMMAQATPQFVISDSERADLLASQCTQVILIDRLELEAKYSYNSSMELDSIAYIIYTSGSTGQPKGIMVKHKSLVEFVASRLMLYPDKMISLLNGSISFDPTIFTILCSLSRGGCLCVDGSDFPDAKKAVATIEKERVNFLLCVPSLYQMMLSLGCHLSSLKAVSLAGEPLSPSLAALHAQLAPNAALYNEYGPSEYAIGTTMKQVYDPKTCHISPITVGKPLESTKVYVLNERLERVKEGEKGEICIAGEGLAVGYLKQAALTAEKFVVVEGLESMPIRIYRTGDVGRFLDDGELEFIGRLDDQVKIRGYRVELGEIEHTLLCFPGIVENAVILKGQDRLVAYFTANEAMALNELRVYLHQKLPYYMIPSAIYQLETLPRTTHGKIDRRSLRERVETDLQEEVTARSEMEHRLRSIWLEVLQCPSVGIRDHFFACGGNSLLLAEVASKLKMQDGIEVSLIQLFEYPTIEQCARYLELQQVSLPKDLCRQENRRAAFLRFKERTPKLG